MKKIFDICFIVILCSLTTVPILFFNFKPNQVSKAENRQLAEFPAEFQGFSNYMNSLDTYINDRIGFRDTMVTAYNETTVGTLKSHHDNVIFGDDGWLFYSGELSDYTGTNIDYDKIERYVEILVALDKKFAERGTEFVFMIGPNKSTIYSEYMPDYIKKSDVTFADLLVKRLKEEGISVVYPKEQLIANKDKELYQKLDTHWNHLGSKYAIDELCNELGLEIKDIPANPVTLNNGDLLTMLSVKSVGSKSLDANVAYAPNSYRENFNDTKKIYIHSSNKPSFMSCRDSYSIALLEYYSYYFDGPLYWDPYVTKAFSQEPTDFFIFETVERFISNIEASEEILK